MEINGRPIDNTQSPFIVAEIGASHGGSFARCMLLMGLAAGAGAHAIKLQCYTADSITLNSDLPDFVIKDGRWKGRKLHELYEKAYTPFEWFADLFSVSRQHGYPVFSSVFDRASVDRLEKIGCPAYKIASMEIIDIPLIAHAAQTGKPIIISTGMASHSEIEEALVAAGNNVALLHCVSGYPTQVANSNLIRLVSMLDNYNCPVGLSDHSLGSATAVAATVIGANIIEKHIRDWHEDTEDAAFAMNPDDFRNMCKDVTGIWHAMRFSDTKNEESSRQFRRSLYVVQDIRAGEPFTEQNIRSIRPGYGIVPKYLPELIGKRAVRDIKRGTALQWEMINRVLAS